MRDELIILGHDPGASGAFALMTGSGKLLGVLDTPVLYLGKKTLFYTAHFCEWYAKVTARRWPSSRRSVPCPGRA